MPLPQHTTLLSRPAPSPVHTVQSLPTVLVEDLSYCRIPTCRYGFTILESPILQILGGRLTSTTDAVMCQSAWLSTQLSHSTLGNAKHLGVHWSFWTGCEACDPVACPSLLQFVPPVALSLSLAG